MGIFFYRGIYSVSKSLYRAKYYFEECARNKKVSVYYRLSITLLELNEIQYKDVDAEAIEITGHSCIPRVLYWARKAMVNDTFSVGTSNIITEEFRTSKAAACEKYRADASELIERLENQGKKSCANCKRDAQCFSRKMKRCTRCKAAWYCGRECQLKHWKDGHKIDCVKHG